MEVSWEAFENVGIDVTTLQGSQTGIFAGIFTDDYKLLQGKALPYNDPDIYFATGTSMSSPKIITPTFAENMSPISANN